MTEGLRPPHVVVAGAKPITYRPSPETYRRLLLFAQEHVWSFNTAVEQLVIEALDAREKSR